MPWYSTGTPTINDTGRGLKLQECHQKEVANPKAQWHRKVEILRKLLPENTAIPFAKIGTTLLSSECDVLSLSVDDLQQLLRQGAPLTDMMLIKERHKDDDIKDDLTEILVDGVAPGCLVNVGDPSSDREGPTKMPIEDVIAAIKGTKALPGGLPFTLLDLELQAKVPPVPSFLDCRRFKVMDLISKRLKAEISGLGKMHTYGMLADLASSKASSIWSSDGGITLWHQDILPGYVYVPWQAAGQGFKAWIVPARSANKADFEEQGEDWAPEVRVLILEPGDCLIMPTPTPHAVLTVGNTWMHNGMFIDLHNITVWLGSLIRVARNPGIANEPIPMELLRGWHHLRDLFFQHVKNSVSEGTIAKEDGDGLMLRMLWAMCNSLQELSLQKFMGVG
ncbi:hypothetical protein NLG97_g293 [Lecanicillium saksenae]|uniref:Uncharacterized protein n=1 Tax=Lecanicillium saksenae TaxID=468837 RepID=A0ACC1R6Y8_9HYPO|nr:hypothetical protein NLG97_g293 [Lecanicillium saksenae]